MARQRWEDEFWEKISGSDLAKHARIRKSQRQRGDHVAGKRSRMGITANTERPATGRRSTSGSSTRRSPTRTTGWSRRSVRPC
jgi:hypothetical protein